VSIYLYGTEEVEVVVMILGEYLPVQCTWYRIGGSSRVMVLGEYLPVHGTEKVEVVVMVRGENLASGLNWNSRLTDVGKIIPRRKVIQF
jgi:hypothetical protein